MTPTRAERPRTTPPTVRTLAIAALAAALAGCSGGGSGGGTGVNRDVTRGLDATDRYLSSNPGARAATSERARQADRPVALLAEDVITWEEIRPRLIEAVGGPVLEEMVLERMLERECRRRGIEITARELAAERDLLAQAFAITGAAPGRDRAAGERVLAQVRRERGLGEVRFAALLRRTAMMRRLVQTEVAVTPDAIRLAYDIRYGERFRVRLMTVGSAREAMRIIERLRDGEPFDALAMEVSTDVSSIRGGLIEPISPEDPAWPLALRQALRTMTVGEVRGSPVALETGFAVLRLEERLAPATDRPSPELVRSDLEQEVRVRQERLLMNRLARRLIAEAPLSVVDTALRTAWEDRRQAD